MVVSLVRVIKLKDDSMGTDQNIEVNIEVLLVVECERRVPGSRQV